VFLERIARIDRKQKRKYSIQAGELSENSLISEIFVSILEKCRQVFLLNAYGFRDFSIF
jgi:hypothetical protein